MTFAFTDDTGETPVAAQIPLGDYELINGDFAGANLANFVLPTAPAGQSYTLSTSVNPGYVDLVVAVVPKPGTLALLGAGFLGLFGLCLAAAEGRLKTPVERNLVSTEGKGNGLLPRPRRSQGCIGARAMGGPIACLSPAAKPQEVFGTVRRLLCLRHLASCAVVDEVRSSIQVREKIRKYHAVELNFVILKSYDFWVLPPPHSWWACRRWPRRNTGSLRRAIGPTRPTGAARATPPALSACPIHTMGAMVNNGGTATVSATSAGSPAANALMVGGNVGQGAGGIGVGTVMVTGGTLSVGTIQLPATFSSGTGTSSSPAG